MNPLSKKWLLPRRTFLKGALATLPLPLLDAMVAPSYGRSVSPADPIRRFVSIFMGFGMRAKTFYPATEGSTFEPTRMLKHLEEFRQDYTVMYGLSHTQVRGGHGAAKSLLTGTNPTSMGGGNTISLDQEIAEKLGRHTRFDSFVMSERAGSSVSWSRATTQVPSVPMAATFEKMFGNSNVVSPAERKRAYDLNKSMLDDLLEQAKGMKQKLGAADKRKLDEYLDSVRGVEKGLDKREAWSQKPKPRNPGYKLAKPEDMLDAFKLSLDIIKLAFVTDSTRVVSLMPGGSRDVFPRLGTTTMWHGLSHNSQDPDLVRQLALVEDDQMKSYAYLMKMLKEIDEQGRSLLDNTLILIGDSMHDGNHRNTDLPIIVAGHGGGQVNHGNFWKYPSVKTPLTNLYVSMAQQMGVEIDRFGP